jgi:hypothetical protein
MDTCAVHVVLGEGEPGILRMVLEAQGFVVVGHARGEEELGEVLAVTHPTVIVLDAGISALAASDVHTRTGAPVVVVWPRDTVATLAEERVDPGSVIMELGPAVRRAARHAAPAPREPILIPDVALEEPQDLPPVTSVGGPGAGSRRRRALALATAWAISLTSIAAIAVAVPSAIQQIREARDSRASTPDRPGPSSAESREDGSTPAPDRGGEARNCSGGGTEDPGDGTGRGKPVDPGNGCATGQGKSGQEHGQGHGRPDEPGDQGRRPDAPGDQGGGRPDSPGDQGRNGGGPDKDKSDTPSDDAPANGGSQTGEDQQPGKGKGRSATAGGGSSGNDHAKGHGNA